MELDYVGSEEEKLISSASRALMDLQTHLDRRLGSRVHRTYETRVSLCVVENHIRYLYKHDMLEREVKI